MTVTSYDSKGMVLSKYGEQAAACIKACKEGGAAVLHGIDATMLPEHFSAGEFKRIIFNFPHTGAQRVHTNRVLISGFFLAADKVLARGGEVHMALKLAPPYSRWGAEDLAQAAGFVHFDTLPFDPTLFPGYRHQTTQAEAKSLDTQSRAALKQLKTLVFRRRAGGQPKETGTATGKSTAAALIKEVQGKDGTSDGFSE